MTLSLRLLPALVLLVVAGGAQGQSQDDWSWIAKRRGEVVAASLDFGTMAPGCYASGTVVGGLALSITRAGTSNYRDAAGDWQACGNNTFRVGYVGNLTAASGVYGLITEPAATNLHPSPTSPAAGTATATATGDHVFWVEGTGSQAISAGTATASAGLPCTATAAAPCRFTLSVAGTLSLAAVTGTLARAQIEARHSPTSFTATSRLADGVVTFTTPTALTSAGLCTHAQVINLLPWNTANTGLVSLGAYNAANSVFTWQESGAFNSSTYASGPETRVAFGTFGNPYGGHDFSICNKAGAITTYLDGAVGFTATRALTGVATAGRIGFYTTSGPLVIRKIVLTAGGTWTDQGRAVKRTACVGDSIVYGYNASVTSAFCNQLAFPTKGMSRYAYDKLGYSGETTTQIRARWEGGIAAKRYDTLVYMAGVNDLRAAATGAATWANSKAIIDSALAGGAHVIAMTITPYESASGGASGQAQLDAYNTALLTYVPSVGADRYHTYDAYALAVNGGTAYVLNATYDSGDTLHPNTAWHTALATALWTTYGATLWP